MPRQSEEQRFGAQVFDPRDLLIADLHDTVSRILRDDASFAGYVKVGLLRQAAEHLSQLEGDPGVRPELPKKRPIRYEIRDGKRVVSWREGRDVTRRHVDLDVYTVEQIVLAALQAAGIVPVGDDFDLDLNIEFMGPQDDWGGRETLRPAVISIGFMVDTPKT